jgi:hypothetical protein
MHFHVHFIPHFETRKLEERGIEDDTLRVTDFGDRLDHHKTLYYGFSKVKPATPSTAPATRSTRRP